MAQWVKNLPAMQETQETQVWSRVRKIPWRRKWQPTPVFLPGESHGQRSLAGYSPWGHKELDMTEWISTYTNKLQKERGWERKTIGKKRELGWVRTRKIWGFICSWGWAHRHHHPFWSHSHPFNNPAHDWWVRTMLGDGDMGMKKITVPVCKEVMVLEWKWKAAAPPRIYKYLIVKVKGEAGWQESRDKVKRTKMKEDK